MSRKKFVIPLPAREPGESWEEGRCFAAFPLALSSFQGRGDRYHPLS